MPEPRNPRTVAGLVLIVLGVALFVFQQARGWIGPEVVLLLVGVAFLTAYFLHRNYGYLIPGCILTGMGAGSLYGGSFFSMDSSLFGLGCGFIAIYLIGWIFRQHQHHWWPLIPGGTLILLSQPDADRIIRSIFRNWPVILIGIGVLLVLSALWRPAGRGSAER